MRRLILKLFNRQPRPQPVVLETLRLQNRAKTAPVTSLRDATTAALGGQPDATVDYSKLVEAWKQPLRERGQ